jgi:ribA/ribD-fused uncharacterized protein
VDWGQLELRMTDITLFRNDNFYLSNFFESPFIDKDKSYVTAEHYYQSKKTEDNNLSEKIRLVDSPGMAKKLAQNIEIRKDWKDIRIDVMRKAIILKFDQNIDIKEKLLNTGTRKLIEGNYWGDKFWGADIETLKGKNMLGKLLMEYRDGILNEILWDNIFR